MEHTRQTSVVTLISDPVHFVLNETEVNAVIDAMQANGAIIEGVAWLSEEEACDIYFAVLPRPDTDDMLQHLLEYVPVDHVVQSAVGRRKELLICDMDSTIITVECIDEMADMLGIKEKIAAITERAMNGELDFKKALEERVMLLKGLPEEALQKVYDERISLTSGAKELVHTMRKTGAKTVLVSGGFTFFTSRVKEAAGFDVEEGNILEIEDGKLTGRVKYPILDKEAKRNALEFYASEMRIDLYKTLAVGDGANDLPMIQSAGLGVAFRAKPAVRAAAGAKISHCDLKAALYIQGYTKDEISS